MNARARRCSRGQNREGSASAMPKIALCHPERSGMIRFAAKSRDLTRACKTAIFKGNSHDCIAGTPRGPADSVGIKRIPSSVWFWRDRLVNLRFIVTKSISTRSEVIGHRYGSEPLINV